MTEYNKIIRDLETCSKGAPCADCKQPKAWNCDWMLMERAKAAIIELVGLHCYDMSEIVNLRRQIEALKMKEEEKLQDLKEGNRSPYRRDNG